MLTAMQKKVLKYYEKYISENGHSPTYQQAADALKKVKSTIYVNVAQLSNKGFMRYSRNGVEIVSKSERSLENAIS